MAFEEDLDLFDTVHETRANALKIFEKKGFPSKRDEAWKYTSLESLINQDYSLFPKSEISIELKEVKKYFLYDTDLSVKITSFPLLGNLAKIISKTMA